MHDNLAADLIRIVDLSAADPNVRDGLQLVNRTELLTELTMYIINREQVIRQFNLQPDPESDTSK